MFTRPHAPSIEAPDTATVLEDTALSLGAVRVADADVEETYGGVLEVRLQALHGSLSLSQTGGLYLTAGSAAGSAETSYGPTRSAPEAVVSGTL